MYTVKDLKFDFKTFVNKRPFLYPVYRIYPKFRQRLVTKNTDICIEGFPRSGNTFAVHTFKYFNPDAQVAHHIHAPVQFFQAVKLKIPCLIMVRNPLDTIASVVVVDRSLSIEAALNHYISYYKMLINFKESEYIILADIEIINKMFDQLMSSINKRFNKSFNSVALNMENKAEIANIVKYQNKKANNPKNLVAIPNKKKEKLKDKIKPKVIDNYLYSDAEQLYFLSKD